MWRAVAFVAAVMALVLWVRWGLKRRMYARAGKRGKAYRRKRRGKQARRA